MINEITILKGIHPGLVLERELKKRNLPKGRFALSLDEFPQLIGDITKGKRKLSPRIALKLDKALGKEEGFFMVLQAYYEIEEEKQKNKLNQHPDFSELRPALFWDTSPEKIDWEKQKNAVIKRVFERGNQKEKDEITRFYGKEIVEKNLRETSLASNILNHD
jgi:antitoxin HigA-1